MTWWVKTSNVTIVTPHWNTQHNVMYTKNTDKRSKCTTSMDIIFMALLRLVLSIHMYLVCESPPSHFIILAGDIHAHVLGNELYFHH